MTVVEVLVQRLDPGLPMPAREHPGDAGLDLRSRLDVRLEPGGRSLVPTGVAIALPSGFAAFVHPRSGMALRHGVTVLNAPGTIDAGYRGEISIILVNHDRFEAFDIARGDRIAQLIVSPVVTAAMVEVSDLPGSHRGSGGFGSTGGFLGTVTS
ncbi:MAG: dUTP diphosphatase [Actinobacteria bacterium]|uniref:dUTP diphosphatase n=1 Tax=freshwater metagenome TaxID=449393 RepID=A0A6J6U6D2_9ZZZZ|nr:dUTP diphosphatase [Actinomycetota bacterium]MSY95272.1 dUTP diphosphatase [Actinomycetota bacterium]